MEYRTLPHDSETKINPIGMGTSMAEDMTSEELENLFNKAIDSGINYIDLAGGHGRLFGALGKAMKGRREKVYVQGHFGADYSKGDYAWTLNLGNVKKGVEWMLEQLQTDYIDFGMIRCLDETKDLDTYIKNGVLDYLLDMKKKGVVRHIGLSSHTPELVEKALELGILDVVMFSINPLYDHEIGDFANGSYESRQVLYKKLKAAGVDITVMKPYAGGALLDEKKSPFGQALTPAQCLQYALDRDGVLCVLPGYHCEKDMREALAVPDLDQDEKDYTTIPNLNPRTEPSCVYCRHCHPCPAGLDIALINKYYDLAKLGDEIAADHYSHLDRKAEYCIHCGHCTSRCPFHVDQMARMDEIREYFANRAE